MFLTLKLASAVQNPNNINIDAYECIHHISTQCFLRNQGYTLFSYMEAFVRIKYKMVSIIKLCYNIQYTKSIYSLIALIAKHVSSTFFVLINRYSPPIETQQLK